MNYLNRNKILQALTRLGILAKKEGLYKYYPDDVIPAPQKETLRYLIEDVRK